MHGNVWEWCADFLNEDYYRESPHQDPPGPPTGKWNGQEDTDRVSRGGSWAFVAEYCRSGYRNGDDPANRNRYLGFRVLRPLSSSQAEPAGQA